MKRGLRLSSQAYLFGDGRIQSRSHKLNITAFFLFQPNSSFRFQSAREEIEKSSLTEAEKGDLLKKFDDVKTDWKNTATETLLAIDKKLSEPDGQQSSSQSQLVTETTKLVIGGRTFESGSSSGNTTFGISDEITRYTEFSFAEFVKCEFLVHEKF